MDVMVDSGLEGCFGSEGELVAEAAAIVRDDADPAAFLSKLERLAADKSPCIRSCVANAAAILAKSAGSRAVFPILLKLMDDCEELVAGDAIISAAQIKDSRAIFYFAKLYPLKGYETRGRVVLALNELQDPRAMGLLQKLHCGETNEALQKQIGGCIRGYIAAQGSSKKFFYTYAGDEAKRKEAESAKECCRIAITRAQDFKALERRNVQPYLRMEGECINQTFVVDSAGKLFIGGALEEHVGVAIGGDVLSAGELLLKKNMRNTA